MLHCITIPSDRSKYKRSIVWSSIRNLSEKLTIQAFLRSHDGECQNKTWSYWKNIGYEVVPLYRAQHLLTEQLTHDQQTVAPLIRPKPFQKVEVHHAVVSGLEVVDNGAVCVLGDGAAQHLPQTQGWPTQAVDG